MLKTLGVKPTKQIPQGLVELAQQETLELKTSPNCHRGSQRGKVSLSRPTQD